MAQIAITFSDHADGKVDVQIYLDGLVEGEPPTPAQQLAMSMLKSAKDDAAVSDVIPVTA